MQDRLHILVVAYLFPPDAASGSHRTLYFSNQWAKAGDRVTVITVREDCYDSAVQLDRGLLAQVDPAITVVRVAAKRPLQALLALRDALRRRLRGRHDAATAGGIPAEAKAARSTGKFQLIKDTVTDLLSLPDVHIGWVPEAVRQASRTIRTNTIDCIYASGGPWSGLLAALRIHRRSGIPLVLDFRDPWVSNPNMSYRSPASRWFQKRMEARCINAARVVIANTEELRQDFIRRYPNIDPARFITIPNGFEEVSPSEEVETGTFRLVHAGALYQSRNPGQLLQAVRELVADGVIAAQEFRVQLIGELAMAESVPEMDPGSGAFRGVLEIVPWVAHDEALRLQKRASALILIQPGYPLQVPRKLYEYVSLMRPVLAITEENSATARVVRELNTGLVVANDKEEIKSAIVELYRRWRSGEPTRINSEALNSYLIRNLARRVRNIMRAL
jgi:glycosyltransferase involved in cell wall biosynthesis